MKRLPADVLGVLSDRRSQSELLRDRRVFQLHEQYSKLEKLDRQIRICKAERLLNLLENDDDRKCVGQLDKLLAEKERFMAEERVSSDYDTVIPFCKICGDEGYSNGKICKCVWDLLIPSYLADSGLDQHRGIAFSAYTDTYYSAPAKMKPIKAFCELYCRPDFMNRPNLLFWGNSGTGKTYMAVCVARELIRQAIPVLIIRSPELMETMEEYRTLKRSFSPDSQRDALISRRHRQVMETEFLIIDELGVEAKGPNNTANLLQILGSRQQKGLTTLITTNLSLKELGVQYDNRLYSRLIGDYKKFHFEGDDIRVGEKYRRSEQGGKI